MPRYSIDDEWEKEKRQIEKVRKERVKREKPPKVKKEKYRPPKEEPVVIPQEDEYIVDPVAQKRKKKIAILISLIVCVFAALFIYRGFKSSKEEVSDASKLKEGEVLMPNVAGYDIEAAKEVLEQNELTPNIIYSSDQFCIYDTVIKTDINKNTPVKKGSEVSVYVCQQVNIPDKIDVKVEPTPYEKDHMEVVSLDIEGETFVANIKNAANVPVKTITYTLLYRKEDGTRVGERTYIKDGLNLQPGETVSVRNFIKAPCSCTLSITRFFCIAGSEKGDGKK